MTDSKQIHQSKTLSISARGLKGKQSVRATFRLSEGTIQLLGIVAAQLGLKQKSLFDQLIEDRDVLSQVAQMADRNGPAIRNRRQKTFVLNKKSLEVLESVARKQNIPRDLLVEVSIGRLIPIMDAEQEKHEKRIRIHKEMKSCYDQCQKLQKKTAQLLGENDRTYLLAEKITSSCARSIEELETLLKNGQDMAKYETAMAASPQKKPGGKAQ